MKKLFTLYWLIFAIALLGVVIKGHAQPTMTRVYDTIYDYGTDPPVGKARYLVTVNKVVKDGKVWPYYANSRFYSKDGNNGILGYIYFYLPAGSTVRITCDAYGFDGTLDISIPAQDSVQLSALQPASTVASSQAGYSVIRELDGSPSKTVQGNNDTLNVDGLVLKTGSAVDTLQATFGSLADVDTSGLSDGDVVVWDLGTGTFIMSAGGGGSGDITAVTAGNGLGGGGTTGAVTLTANVHPDSAIGISGDSLALRVDNSTINIASNKVQIKDGGVGATQIASTAVTPGSYTNTDLTVDADGRITAASNGSGGSSDSSWTSISTDTINAFNAGADFVFTARDTGVISLQDTLMLPLAALIRLDGSKTGDTYIHNNSTNQIQLVAGGNAYNFNSSGIDQAAADAASLVRGTSSNTAGGFRPQRDTNASFTGTTSNLALQIGGTTYQHVTSSGVFFDQLTSNGLVTTSGGTGLTSITVPGTGVLAALAINIGSAGAPVLFNGAGGTPSSITLTNASGTAASLTAGAATALAANGTNASAGNAILGVDASGNAEGAFDVWTEAENTAAAYLPAAIFPDSIDAQYDWRSAYSSPTSGDSLWAIRNGVTGFVDVADLPTGGGGEANTISSQGGGVALTAATSKSGVDLRIISVPAFLYAVNADTLAPAVTRFLQQTCDSLAVATVAATDTLIKRKNGGTLQKGLVSTIPVAVGQLTGLGTGVATALAVNVGSAGAFVVLNGALGTPSSGTLTNATGLPIATGVSGLGTGIATALAVNVGSAGAPVLFDGAGGTPSSINLSNGSNYPETEPNFPDSLDAQGDWRSTYSSPTTGDSLFVIRNGVVGISDIGDLAGGASNGDISDSLAQITQVVFNGFANDAFFSPHNGAVPGDRRGYHQSVLFHDAQDDTAFFEVYVPEFYDGGDLFFDIWGSALTATTNQTIVGVCIERHDLNSYDFDTHSFATAEYRIWSAPGTAGQTDTVTVVLTGAQLDGIVAEDMATIGIIRDGNGTNGTDSMTDSMLMWAWRARQAGQ